MNEEPNEGEISEETLKALPKQKEVNKVHVLHGLPNYLKDPANYEKIQKAIINAGATRHSHSEVADWAGCFHCQQKEWDRKEMMLGLGFTSGRQYMVWKKVIHQMNSMTRDPLI